MGIKEKQFKSLSITRNNKSSNEPMWTEKVRVFESSDRNSPKAVNFANASEFSQNETVVEL